MLIRIRGLTSWLKHSKQQKTQHSYFQGFSDGVWNTFNLKSNPAGQSPATPTHKHDQNTPTGLEAVKIWGLSGRRSKMKNQFIRLHHFLWKKEKSQITFLLFLCFYTVEQHMWRHQVWLWFHTRNIFTLFWDFIDQREKITGRLINPENSRIRVSVKFCSCRDLSGSCDVSDFTPWWWSWCEDGLLVHCVWHWSSDSNVSVNEDSFSLRFSGSHCERQ